MNNVIIDTMKVDSEFDSNGGMKVNFISTNKISNDFLKLKSKEVEDIILKNIATIDEGVLRNLIIPNIFNDCKSILDILMKVDRIKYQTYFIKHTLSSLLSDKSFNPDSNNNVVHNFTADYMSYYKYKIFNNTFNEKEFVDNFNLLLNLKNSTDNNNEENLNKLFKNMKSDLLKDIEKIIQEKISDLVPEEDSKSTKSSKSSDKK